MRIIIYVMSFFTISAGKDYNEKELFKSEKYSQYEKYPNLQNSCQTAEGKMGFLGSIKGKYSGNNNSCLSGLFGETYLDKIKKHKYYKEDVIQLKVYEEYLGKNENKILPTLLDLLDAIPDKIIIKKGIIYTETDSIVSGIDITETISTDATNSNNDETYTDIPSTLKCDSRSAKRSTPTDVKHEVPPKSYEYGDFEYVMAPETSEYADLDHVIMDGSKIYALYKCGTLEMGITFGLSDEESEEKIIKKIDMPCTLRLDPTTTMNKFFTDLIPTLSTNERDSLKKLYNSSVQFELRFSYICKFVSPLQTFVNKNILQYKILNFTVSGYQLKKFKFSPQCIGLTYCLKHLNTKEYVSNLEEYFLYKFGNTEITNEGS
ncbi:uncharacterized protein LOC142333251 isoform X2 [Lycorma delicatula]|uniref:uncharacterized protein LOC142333251 isoform X2 n=1 Tax=Lycorma delicatula TaxID=130591 RepID=UPI003F517279